MAYQKLQAALSKKQYLVHFNPARQLYIDIDARKEGMGAMIFHLKTTPTSNLPSRSSIEPIMFLSPLLTPAETRYWPTELEMAGLVWFLRKTRHLVEAAEVPTVVYTDHGASLGIAKQTMLSTSSADKLNLRLVRASDYVQRFQLVIKHKPGKQHIIPDALSRLEAEGNGQLENQGEGKLDVLFTTTLIEMNKEFREKLIQGYKDDRFWSKITNLLHKEKTSLSPPGLPFCLENNLIFRRDGYVSSDHAFEPCRLCIPQPLVKEILKANHDENGHLGFLRCYERVSSSYYIRNLSAHPKAYLKHCASCNVNQTRRHPTYEIYSLFCHH